MQAQIEPLMSEAVPEPDSDQRVLLSGISWQEYEDLRRAMGERRGVRMTYLDGELEIMATSPGHEFDKTIIGRLVEAFGDEYEIPLAGCGSATWKQKAKRAGLEADECYFHGKIKPVPDLAIEIVKTSGGVDKLAVYRRLGIPEVWIWARGVFQVFVLGPRGYRETKRSALLPALDLDAVAEIVRAYKPEDQSAAVRRFRASLRR